MITITLYTTDSGANPALRKELTAEQREWLHVASRFASEHDFTCEVASVLVHGLHACDLRDVLQAAARGELTSDVTSEDSGVVVNYVDTDSDGNSFSLMAVISRERAE